jgi:hypothetical protein
LFLQIIEKYWQRRDCGCETCLAQPPPPADLGHAARRSRDDLGEVVIENSALRWPPKTATDIGVFGVRMVPDF